MRTQEGDDPAQWGQFLGLGMQMAVGVLLGVFVGWWLDHKFGWQPWGVLVGAMTGLAGGLYLLFKETMTAAGRHK